MHKRSISMLTAAATMMLAPTPGARIAQPDEEDSNRERRDSFRSTNRGTKHQMSKAKKRKLRKISNESRRLNRNKG